MPSDALPASIARADSAQIASELDLRTTGALEEYCENEEIDIRN
jgi:hypothetical protein